MWNPLGVEVSWGQPIPGSTGSPAVDTKTSFILAGLELGLPMFVNAFEERLARYMSVVNEKELTKLFTDDDFEVHILKRVQGEFPGALKEPKVKIRSDGFQGSLKMKLSEEMNARLAGRVGIQVVEDRPHVVLYDLKVDEKEVSPALLKSLEWSINTMIDGHEFPLKVKRFWMYEGSVMITVEFESK